jgi:hypothetical protein
MNYGTHNNVSFEIKQPHDYYGWTWYLYIALDNLKDAKLAESLWIPATLKQFGSSEYESPDYYKSEFLNEIPFHCGITYYSKQLLDSDGRIIKVGCDYRHCWDEGKTFSLTQILEDVENACEFVSRYLKPKEE